MSVLLFKLYNVPEDEAEDVRQLLLEQGFQTYETQAGFFGLGVAAIWLQDKAQLESARKVIDHYQIQRSAEQRQRYADLKASGQAPTLSQKMVENPLRFVATVVIIIAVALLSLVPLWSFLTA